MPSVWDKERLKKDIAGFYKKNSKLNETCQSGTNDHLYPLKCTLYGLAVVLTLGLVLVVNPSAFDKNNTEAVLKDKNNILSKKKSNNDSRYAWTKVGKGFAPPQSAH